MFLLMKKLAIKIVSIVTAAVLIVGTTGLIISKTSKAKKTNDEIKNTASSSIHNEPKSLNNKEDDKNNNSLGSLNNDELSAESVRLQCSMSDDDLDDMPATGMSVRISTQFDNPQQENSLIERNSNSSSTDISEKSHDKSITNSQISPITEGNKNVISIIKEKPVYSFDIKNVLRFIKRMERAKTVSIKNLEILENNGNAESETQSHPLTKEPLLTCLNGRARECFIAILNKDISLEQFVFMQVYKTFRLLTYSKNISDNQFNSITKELSHDLIVYLNDNYITYFGNPLRSLKHFQAFYSTIDPFIYDQLHDKYNLL